MIRPLTSLYTVLAPPLPRRPAPSRPLVLAVDDDVVQRELLQETLRAGGFDVVLAADAHEAIALYRQRRPQAIVTDAAMPFGSGFDLLGELRWRIGDARVPVIMVSGHDDVAAKVGALDGGADDFLAKPFAPAELNARLRAHLRVAEQMTAQTAGLLADLRSIREGTPSLLGDDSFTDPETAALAALARRPAVMPCVALVTIDAHGTPHFLPHATVVPWSEIAHAGAETLGRTEVVEVAAGPAARCPVCGGPGTGRTLATTLGTWNGQTMHLFAGCASPTAVNHPALFGEFAAACRTMFDVTAPSAETLADHRRIESVIESRAFSFAFQPIVTMATARTIGYEALARFDDGTPAEQMLVAADATGRRIALETVLLAGAIDAAAELPRDSWVHLNVSPQAARSDRLIATLYGTDRRVVLEITEHQSLDRATIEAIRDALPPNCKIAIDDVGAGYAGLTQLLDLRPDIVKLDRTMVEAIDTDPARQALVAGLVQFGAVTDAMVIAEGIERDRERQVLRNLGVRFGQGYLFAPPGPPS